MKNYRPYTWDRKLSIDTETLGVAIHLMADEVESKPRSLHFSHSSEASTMSQGKRMVLLSCVSINQLGRRKPHEKVTYSVS